MTTATPRKQPDTLAQATALVDLGLRAGEGYGRADLVARLARARAELDSPGIHVVVAGEFKQGKSSLVNALLGSNICPVDDDVATAVPTFVRFGPEVHAEAVVEETAADGSLTRHRQEIAVEDIRRYVVERSAKADRATAVDVQLPRKMLAGGLVIVDTPGVGGLGSSHAVASLGAISMADAVIFVSDASQEYTRTELGFLRQAAELCPTIVAVLTKTDFYPAWRKVKELDEGHLRTAGLTMDLYTVSSPLRARAVHTNDTAMNAESGFTDLVRFVTERVGKGTVDQLAASAAGDVIDACRQLESQFDAERAAISDPAATQAVIEELTRTKERAEALKGAAARWSQTLADGVGDLTSDIDHDLRGRIRRVVAEADEAIDAADPADTWAEMEGWLDSRASYEMVANYTYLRDRAAELSGNVARHFVEASGQVLDELAVYNPSVVLSSARSEHRVDMSRMSIGKQTMVALRSTYGGVLMFTMLGSFVGIALGPLGVGIGLVMGRKGLREEKQRQLMQRRAQAKNAVRKYCDEVTFVMGKDSRDTLRRIQRQLRDYYSGRADELQRSTTEVLIKATESAKQTQVERDRRVKDIDAELARIRQVLQRAEAFRSTLAVAAS